MKSIDRTYELKGLRYSRFVRQVWSSVQTTILIKTEIYGIKALKLFSMQFNWLDNKNPLVRIRAYEFYSGLE